MEEQQLRDARIRAEKAVADMKDGDLKLKAFEVILTQLISSSGTTLTALGVRSDATTRRPPSAGQPTSLAQRILALQSEGFFKEQQTISRVREGLSVRGWHYPLTTLSGALQGLVQKRRLRRERVRDKNKTVWRYSNP